MPDFGFDIELLYFLNQYARTSIDGDYLTGFVSGNHLIKGGLPVALIWYAWFGKGEEHLARARLIATFAACLIGIAVARLLALKLPFRSRPIHNEELDFVFPYGVSPKVLDGWSSFPSDHAVLFFTLATGLFCVSRKLGAFALLYVSLIVALPRVYLGLHYPTDILAGAALGAFIALALQHKTLLGVVWQPVERWSERNPGIFYALLFLLSYQIADIFNSSRSILELLNYLVTR